MHGALGRAVKRAFRAAGFDIIRHPPNEPAPVFPLDFSEEDIALCTKVRPFTLGEDIAIQMTATGVEYILKGGIPGAIVECGVWKGGMMMVAAETLLKLGDTSREIFLHDTFEGMPDPTDAEVSFWGARPFESAKAGRTTGCEIAACLSRGCQGRALQRRISKE